MSRTAAITSYIALGDSFTEGLNDFYPYGGPRGWADRLASRLARDRPDLRYANLAVRGKRLGEVVAEQVPLAVELVPDLVTLAAGGNDLLRPRTDPDTLATTFDAAVAGLRAAGSEVVVFTGFDTRDVPLLRRLRGKIAMYNLHLRAIADRHGCPVVDLWAMDDLHDRRAWSDDRLHLSPEGHRRVAVRAYERLAGPSATWGGSDPGRALDGAPGPDQAAPWPYNARIPPLTAAQNLVWARRHLLPWISRRVRGRSSGDGRDPKRPDLGPLPSGTGEW